MPGRRKLFFKFVIFIYTGTGSIKFSINRNSSSNCSFGIADAWTVVGFYAVKGSVARDFRL
jgi:hypothetical protein